MLQFSIQIRTAETFDGSRWWRECWLQKDFESEAELSDSERRMSRPWGLRDKLYFPQLNSISVWRVRIMKAAGFCFVLFFLAFNFRKHETRSTIHYSESQHWNHCLIFNNSFVANYIFKDRDRLIGNTRGVCPKVIHCLYQPLLNPFAGAQLGLALTSCCTHKTFKPWDNVRTKYIFSHSLF